MNGLLNSFGTLSTVKKIVLVASVILTVFLTLFAAQLSHRTDMALLYAGLEGRVAGDVVARLDRMDVSSEMRGDAIYVERADRDRVRMTLAASGLPASGLPASGQRGYELLDGLSGFGTTAEMFDAAYWRAKEGELARTLLAAPGVSVARVHIGTPRRRGAGSTPTVPGASITLTGASGPVSRSSAMAARYLVSLAVPGLVAGQVAVIDSQNGVLLRSGGEAEGAGFGDSERARKMKTEIGAILAARVGMDRARVSVNIETTRESERVSRRVIDPDSKSLRQSQTTEIAQTGNDTGGSTTVASNLPDGDAANGERSSSRDETVKSDVFDYNETVEEVLRPAGTIKRISVAVLLDEIRTVGPDGTSTSEPRGRAELAKLEKLVKSAIGFDDERGDLVSVESISFADVPQEGTLASNEAVPSFVETNMMQLIQMGVLGLVVLILGLFVVRPVLMAGNDSGAPLLEGETDAALSAIDVTPGAGQAGADYGAAGGFDGMGGSMGGGMGGDMAMAGGAGGSPGAIEMLREAVSAKNDESAAVIQGWLEDGTAAGSAR